MITKYVITFGVVLIIVNLMIIDPVKNRQFEYETFKISQQPPPPKKYVLWKKTGAGWGNRLLGMIKTVVCSIANDMEILMDHDQFEASFSGEYVSKWFSNKRRMKSLLRRAVDVNSKRWNENTPVTLISQNNYEKIPKKWLEKLVEKGILDKPDRMEAIMKIGKMITSSPTKKLLKMVETIKQKSSIPRNTDYTLQIRTMKDYSPGHRIAMSHWKQKEIWDCIRSTIPQNNTVFFTTDEYKLFDIVSNKLKRVYYHKHQFQHTSRTKELIPNSIAEWYLIGESKNVICSFTSFCQSAIARRYGSIKNVYSLVNSYKKEPVECGIINM